MAIRNYLIVALVVVSCTPLSTLSGSAETGQIAIESPFQDAVFRPSIKTVRLYPFANDPTDVLVPASVYIREQNLSLTFDDLTTAYQNYSVRLIHCKADWSKSSLSNLDFLYDYNSFPVNQYAFSSDTHVPYLHYWFTVPPVKISGNYMLVVYLDDATPVLSKRFMVYDKLVQVVQLNDQSGSAQLANKQPISLLMRYPQLSVLNPSTQFEVSIRQNQRWDNIIQNVPPAFFREVEKEIEYRVIDTQYMHDGGNEYRFFDLRSIINPGQNIAQVDKLVKPFTARVGTDRSRESDRYSQSLDFNGNYVVQNYDNGLQYSENYLNVKLSLPLNKRIEGKVYIQGLFANNPFSSETEMIYDSARSEYSQQLLLKQGWYNYQYVVKNKHNSPSLLEGNHFETENSYEVLVYYKSLQPQADLLVGYLLIDKNPR
jgi:Domain of unknown function (DUF5103)